MVREISYTRGKAAGRAKRAEWLYKRIYKECRKLRASMEGRNLEDKIRLQRRIRNLERHWPRLKSLWVCYTWLAEDAAQA